MEIVIKAAQLILSLSILVIIHEFGHFMFAKLFKCRVEKFYLFFDPWFSLFKTKKGETEYGVGWLPLGGYVKIAGMIDESMDKEQLKEEPKEWEFRSKPAWQRLFIMIGGVLNNIILAVVIYAGVLYVYGTQFIPAENVKYGITVNELGQKMGFQNGDKILSVDNKEIVDFNKILPTIVLDGAKSVQVERDGNKVDVPIKSEYVPELLKTHNLFGLRFPFKFEVGGFAKESVARKAGLELKDEILALDHKSFAYFDQFTQEVQLCKNKEVVLTINRNGQILEVPVQLDGMGRLGVYNSATDLSDVVELSVKEYSFFEAIPAGVAKGYDTLESYIKQFKLIFSPETKAYESLGGFISIGKIFPSLWDWQSFWNITAFLSIILAVMNILPIPALDGGHVLFLLVEWITGRKPNEKFLEYAQIAGMVILFALLIFANGNDIIKLFN